MSDKEKKQTLPDDVHEFLKQLIDAYPEEDFQSLKKVIAIGTVVYQDELQPGMPLTAAVKNTKPYTLMLGKKFLEENTETIEDCVYILSHELTHLVLDHFAKDILAEFEDKSLGFKAMHIVVDAQVNATCSNSLTDEKYLRFVKEFYSQTEMPFCFFRPDGIPPTDELKELHKKLYSVYGVSNKDLIEGLMPWFEEQQENLDKMIEKLLGNHKDIFNEKVNDSSDASLDDLVEAVGDDYLKKQKENEQKQGSQDGEEESSGNKAGKGGELRKYQIESKLEKVEYVKSIKRQLKRIEVVSPSSRIYRAIESFFPKKPARTVIPNFYDRTTSALYSKGLMPVFHQNKTIGSKVIVPCYLDVSGSQSHVIPYMLPVVSRLKRKIGEVVHCFSTEVSTTKLLDLKKGKYSSTGGTCFNCLFNHVLKNRFKNVLILTDGEAHLESDLVTKVKKSGIKVTVGWTVSSPNTAVLDQVACKTFYVFK